MAYIVNIDFRDTKTNKSYKKGDKFDGKVYDALLNTNNQYHEAFIIELEDITEVEATGTEVEATGTEVEATGTEDDEKVEDTEELEDLKVAELKKLLDERGIEYTTNAKKDELIKLAGE